jgi:hypothetical protein
MDWQDIETAPHETLVLLYSPPTDWLGGKFEVGYASAGNRVRLPDGSVSSTMHWHGSATHWMPLPEKPGAGSEEDPNCPYRHAATPFAENH